jgi:hypothetical protein
MSPQLPAWHTPLVHTPELQSPPPPQVCPLSHFVEQLPPQSLSVSLPFFTPSVHVAFWHF